ncbi:MAG TPA: VIT domain-containing protein [Acidobacteriota bacterium]|nr:VIT domain-containing protein [Acidobacteriota bacterium]
MNGKAVILITLGVLLACSASAVSDAGVIVPKNIKDTPDPSILSLQRMRVDISIDGQYAKVRVLQIFRNHIERDIEGKYLFTLPDGSQVSDFAIWEDGVRIPGVIVERRRAREIYEELTWMKIDPGLMETARAETPNLFSVEIFPIPAFGTKRVEIEYTANLEVTSLRSFFSFPLKPTIYGKQSCADFMVRLDLNSDFPIRNFKQAGEKMPLEYGRQGAHQVSGAYAARDIEFTEDFAFEYEIDIAESLLSFQTYRDAKAVEDLGPFGGGKTLADEAGYFAASVVYNLNGGAKGRDLPPKDVVLMVDTSLSMQWDKLDKSYEAVEFFLRNLPEHDRFGLVSFNQEIDAFAPELRTATPDEVSAALDFFRSGYMMGGTDIAGAVEAVLWMFNGDAGDRDRYVVLITDGAPTLEELNYARIAERVRQANSGTRAKFMVFGIGGDVNESLLRTLADASGGYYVSASETEDIDFKLRTFLDKLGEKVIAGIGILFRDMENIDRVYPAGEQRAYDRSLFSFIGRYREPREHETASVKAEVDGKRIELEAGVALPEKETEHQMLPRRWAKLRVDHLLRRIDMSEEGENVEPLIEEVIALAKRYKFVTPYTSFLAAPRALLRPRAIKPGDPILRVSTHESITAVVAVFPFGLTKPLHYIADEDVWETRFLAPKWMNDGTYSCTLLLTDTDGNLYEEDKSFVIDSKPPTLKVQTDKKRFLPGESVIVTINADRDTRRLLVRIGALLPAEARYRTELGASRAEVPLPPDLPAGTYTMRVTAVDFARNTTVVEIPVEVTAR